MQSSLCHGVFPMKSGIVLGWENPTVALKASKIPLTYNLTFLSYLERTMWFHLLNDNLAFDNKTSPKGYSIISVVVNITFKPLVLRSKKIAGDLK